LFEKKFTKNCLKKYLPYFGGIFDLDIQFPKDFNNQSLIPNFPLAGIEIRYFKTTNQINF
jgi:hypothetical protein